jgi:uncharacterized protein (TIGR03435 family)
MIGRICLVALLGFGTGLAAAQSPVTPAAPVPTKRLAFDVVSIKQNLSTGQRTGPPQFGPTPDGYRMTSMPLAAVIAIAYPPATGGGIIMPDHVLGLPDWATQQRYDIDAKVTEEDMAQWQKPAAQTAMLEAMLQSLLADRCKLQIHRESKESSAYLLVVGKGGPKFKEADPAATHPAGMTLPGGATVVPSENGELKLYGTSMGMLATVLGSMGGPGVGRPIQDKTGLTGRYDIVIPRPDMGGGPGGPDGADRGGMVFSMVEALGLKLESGKSSVETLVVDHIEKPSEN